nr:hypothetical protein [uncultured Peptostreptococcus sp.]
MTNINILLLCGKQCKKGGFHQTLAAKKNIDTSGKIRMKIWL